MNAYLVSRPTPPASLRLTQTPVPAVPDDGVLIRVHASSANPVDLFPTSFAGFLIGGRKPLVLGTDFAGVVESIGAAVTSFRPGDEVFGGGKGGFAEYICVRETDAVSKKPAPVSFEAAGVVAVAGCTALQALRDHGRLESGQTVLINGASGGVGTFAVQIARALGAKVTAVCSTRNVEVARSMGAESIIDYTKTDFTRSGKRYDLVVDIAGSHSFSECSRVIAKGGTHVGVGAAGIQQQAAGTLRAFGHFLGTRITSIGSSNRVVSLFIASLKKDDIAFLGELMADGRVKPVIDDRFSFEQVPEALRQQEKLHARGKIAIAIA